MSEPLDPQIVPDDSTELVDFGDKDLYIRAGISDARWERAKHAVDVRDLLRDLYGISGNPVSCPFHGTDSKPSFYIYPSKNDCWCWGCGEEDGYWSTIKIVTRHFGFRIGDRDDQVEGLKWLESHYPMPELVGDDTLYVPDMIIVDEDEGVHPDEPTAPVLDLKLLQEPYILESIRRRAAQRRPEDARVTAMAYLERLFRAVRQENPQLLARVLGGTKLRELMRHGPPTAPTPSGGYK